MHKWLIGATLSVRFKAKLRLGGFRRLPQNSSDCATRVATPQNDTCQSETKIESGHTYCNLKVRFPNSFKIGMYRLKGSVVGGTHSLFRRPTSALAYQLLVAENELMTSDCPN